MMEVTMGKSELAARAVGERDRTRTAGLTWEAALYLAICLCGLALRLADLGHWPMLEEEATTALGAWRASRGSLWRPLHYSPLLLGFQQIAYALTTSSDAIARLLPALVGGLLPLAFLPMRRALGRYGALAAAALVAMSPTFVFWSRTASWPIITAAAVLLFLTTVLNAEQRDNARGWAALAAGVALVSGPGVYSFVAAGLAYVALRLILSRSGHPQLWRSWVNAARDWLTVPTLAAFGLGVLAVGTMGTLNLDGLGAAADLFSWWVSALFAPSELGPAAAIGRLAVYESFTIVFALMGIVSGLRRRDELTAFLVLWAVVGLITSSLGGHREPTWALGLALPLVVLAGKGLERIATDVLQGDRGFDFVALAVALAVSSFCFLQVARYTHTGQNEALTYGRIAFGMLVVAWAGYWYWQGWHAAARVVSAYLVVVLAIITCRAMVAVAFETGRDPREPMVHGDTSIEMRDWEAWLASYATRTAMDPVALRLAYVESLDPYMGWYLRGYAAAEPVPSASMALEKQVILTLPRAQGDHLPGFAAQRFRLRKEWSGAGLSPREWLRWFMYRDPVGAETAQELQVWVRLPVAE